MRNKNKKKNTGQKISDQLTPSGRPIVNTVNKGNTNNQRSNNTRGGGRGRGRGRGGGSRPDKRRNDPLLPDLIDITKPEKKGFRSIPIIPTEKELLAPRPNDLPINHIDKPYESFDEYLETHYRLLREDCIRPLREGIQHLQSQTGEQIQNLRIYERINLVGITFAGIGVVHRISFVTKHSERVKWATSKRLLPGTLVVFSNDNFNTMKFGTVFDRPSNLLEKTYDLQIDVLFRLEDAEFEWPEGYIMVETTSSYFEAYRHVLNVLQELDPETLPFKEHIIENIEPNQEIDFPEYLQKRYPVYEFKPQESENLYSPLKFDISEEWPTVEKINFELHKSQYEALKMMLTKRLALVQGPPGTGKTYVGLKAVKFLLDNLPYTIVISCQTNHALDQFLEGIQKFEKNIIRLGSRSKSEKIMSRTLYEIRLDMKSSDERPIRSMDINRLFRERDKIEKEMTLLCDEIGNPFIDLDFIKEQGYLTDEQISSLKQDDWFMSSSSGDNDDCERDYIQEWLESSITTTISKQNDDEFFVNQLISEDSGNQTDDDDEVDEEDIDNALADFQGNDDTPITNKDKFVKLRCEKCIRSDTYVSADIIDKHCSAEDLWEIPQEIRVAIHNRWRRARLEEVCDSLKKLCKKYSELSDQIKNERIREDLVILKTARVIGMTTTAAAKYHKLLMNLEPKIMIIEEAAETLEAHVVTALTPATQHLILIGDHQQLRPNISVHELAKSTKVTQLEDDLKDVNAEVTQLEETLKIEKAEVAQLKKALKNEKAQLKEVFEDKKEEVDQLEDNLENKKTEVAQLEKELKIEKEKSYNLNVSLFERLTKYLPYCQLTEQRRMRPEIRELLKPIYGDLLTDHENVSDYPEVPGVFKDLFFFDHSEEESLVVETMSRINEFEAHMCAKFANYLVKVGMDGERIMDAKRITILSMYSGQRKCILKYLRDECRKSPELKNIRVSSVDGFQGEENDIILLSLVRSRDTRYGIGFLGVSNRVCVALSRAKHGLYIFGNASQLKKQSDLWSKVLKILEKRGNCGQRIELFCEKHMKKTMAGDYNAIPPEGGCDNQCGEMMDCGHHCPMLCHGYSHDEIICQENCKKKLPCGHGCNRQCNEPCGKCEEVIMIHPEAPCIHYKEVPCYAQDKYRCKEKCPKKLPCEHQCQEICSSPYCTTLCRALVNIRFTRCGHNDRVFCFKAKEKSQEECPYC